MKTLITALKYVGTLLLLLPLVSVIVMASLRNDKIAKQQESIAEETLVADGFEFTTFYIGFDGEGPMKLAWGEGMTTYKAGEIFVAFQVNKATCEYYGRINRANPDGGDDLYPVWGTIQFETC